MVSPYLERPIRTLEQALKDSIRIRIRSQADASLRGASGRQMSASALSHVHVLLGSHTGSAARGRVRPGSPTDREAA
jgi:hypothetical protein